MKTYEDGLNKAWEVARKIGSNDGYSCGELSDIFGSCSAGYVFDYFTASEAIDAIENHERIKVGDEVKACSGMLGVVLERYDSPFCGCDNEMTMLWANVVVCGCKEQELTKTGRHFPQIEEVLKQMQEEK